MLVSHDWLSEYVDLDMSHDDLVDRLTMTGLNHEGTEQIGSDQTIDLEVTSNRPDCLSHIGVSREIAAVFDKNLTVPRPDPVTGVANINDLFRVRIDCPDLCYRFTARLIRGVKIGPSPDWLVQRLRSILFKRKKDGSIEEYQTVNNVADISNFVMFECGQPLHVFDYQKIEGQEIIVREPKPGEKLVAIDHETYELQPGMCVIADKNRAIGLGGVMGGAETEISDSTVDVLIEAAFFNPVAIRNTSRQLNLPSAASHRFERTIDTHQIDWASQRCCELILEIAGGELAEGIIDVGQSPQPREPVGLRYAQLDRILGIEVAKHRVAPILQSLGFEIQKQDDRQIVVVPPTWRLDVTREIDLIEEVGRIYGYDKVPDNKDVPMSASVISHEERIFEKIGHSLNAAGFDEAMTASLVPEKWSEAFSPWSDAAPLQSSQPMLGVLEKASQNIGMVNLLRRSIVPSLLEVFRINEYKQNEQVDLFEIAKVYLTRPDGLPDEPWKFAMVTRRDYLSLKGVIESIVSLLNPRLIVDADNCDLDILDITYSAKLSINGRPLGWLGQVSDHGKELFGFRRDASVAEIDLPLLISSAVTNVIHHEISPFPAITRDFNFIVDDSIRWGALEATVRRAGGELIESIEYKETFRDTTKDGAGKKRILLSVILRSLEGTLTGNQADDVCKNIIESCAQQHAAQLLS